LARKNQATAALLSAFMPLDAGIAFDKS